MLVALFIKITSLLIPRMMVFIWEGIVIIVKVILIFSIII